MCLWVGRLQTELRRMFKKKKLEKYIKKKRKKKQKRKKNGNYFLNLNKFNEIL